MIQKKEWRKKIKKLQKESKDKMKKWTMKLKNFMTVGNTLLIIMENKQRSQRSANENRDRNMRNEATGIGVIKKSSCRFG